jgi:hypothetical protein
MQLLGATAGYLASKVRLGEQLIGQGDLSRVREHKLLQEMSTRLVAQSRSEPRLPGTGYHGRCPSDLIYHGDSLAGQLLMEPDEPDRTVS